VTAQLVDASHIALTNPESTATVGFTVELPVSVPDVVGFAQAAAESTITSTGLTVGTVTNTASATVPAGDVISQSPVAASQVALGSAVNLVVSTGPAPIAVPNVVGLAQAAAEAAITSVGLSVGTVSTTTSPTVPAGDVISQTPLAASLIPPGSAIELVVSTGPEPVTVPDVVGLAQAAAEGAITSAGLTVGTITSSESDTVPAGDVISQSPLGGTSVPAASLVNLEVSAGPAPVSVPDVVGLAQVAAENAITAAGLTVGNVTTASSLTVPSGNVISQSPIAGTLATAASAVDLVVSSGAVSVPSVIGNTQSQAEAALAAAGLTTGVVTTANSDTVPAGSVISQSPVAATPVLIGSAVDLVVSIGPANQLPAVYAGPDLAGTVGTSVHVDDATASDDGLPVPPGILSLQWSFVSGPGTPTWPLGDSDQLHTHMDFPVAGTYVLRLTGDDGALTAVDDMTVVVSVATVTVPDVVGLSQVAAEGAITSVGLTVGTVSTSTSATVPAGDVISQTPAGSTSVAAGSAVDLVVSVGATPPPTTIIRVNAGGPDFTDSLGQLWSADNGFNTGNLWDDVGPVAGTVEDALYLTERWDPSSGAELEYAFTVPNGTYEVNLHFAEIAYGVAYDGGRVFDVTIEGALVEDNLDIFAQAGGAFTALIKTHTVTVTDGQINIGFGHVVEDPKLSAIEIINQ
jgi:beta-lactam-binding protein with PASTA domain